MSGVHQTLSNGTDLLENKWSVFLPRLESHRTMNAHLALAFTHPSGSSVLYFSKEGHFNLIKGLASFQDAHGPEL